MSNVIGVRFKRTCKAYYFDPGTLEIPLEAGVIVETSRGSEYGICALPLMDVPESKIVQPLRRVIRLVTDHDRETLESNQKKEARAFEICQRKAMQHKLDMKIVDAEYAFDGSKIIFFFTADGRIDFRDLVKDLASEFHTRIELRQIGVRDEAKMLGGLGICGKPFCCSTFLEEFHPVSIKMAKEQNLSLNPVKISGTCGRLMCCLTYEQLAYEDLQRTTPKVDAIVETSAGRGTVAEVNLLRGQVKVRLHSQPDAPLKMFHKSELTFAPSNSKRKSRSKHSENGEVNGCAGCPKNEAAQKPGWETIDDTATGKGKKLDSIF